MKRIALAFAGLVCFITAALGWGFSSPPNVGPLYQIVATNGAYPWLLNDQSASTRTQTISRIPIVFGCDASSVVLAFDNAYLDTTGIIQNQAMTSVQVYLEQASPALSVQIKVGGSGTFTIPAGANAFLTDPILPAAFSQSTFAANSQWWIRLTGQVASTAIWGTGNYANNTGAAAYMYDPANNINQVGNTGALTRPTDASGPNYAVGPTAILGIPVTPSTCRSVLALGASFLVGTNDGVVETMTGPGMIARAALGTGGALTGVIPYTAFKGPGLGAQQAASWPTMQPYFRYANIFYNDMGANDIGSVNNLSLYQAYSYISQLWYKSRGLGSRVRSIVQMRMNPRTTSSDNWTTTNNQTAIEPFNLNNTGAQLNALFDAATTSKVINAQFYLNALRVSTDTTSANNWKWINDGVTAKYATLAGTHPCGTGPSVPSCPGETYASASAELRTVLQGVPINFLLNRDLGAANDNSPAFLEKVA